MAELPLQCKSTRLSRRSRRLGGGVAHGLHQPPGADRGLQVILRSGRQMHPTPLEMGQEESVAMLAKLSVLLGNTETIALEGVDSASQEPQ